MDRLSQTSFVTVDNSRNMQFTDIKNENFMQYAQGMDRKSQILRGRIIPEAIYGISHFKRTIYPISYGQIVTI